MSLTGNSPLAMQTLQIHGKNVVANAQKNLLAHTGRGLATIGRQKHTEGSAFSKQSEEKYS